VNVKDTAHKAHLLSDHEHTGRTKKERKREERERERERDREREKERERETKKAFEKKNKLGFGCIFHGARGELVEARITHAHGHVFEAEALL